MKKEREFLFIEKTGKETGKPGFAKFPTIEGLIRGVNFFL